MSRVELLPGFKFTGKMVKIMEFTGKIGKAGKWKGEKTLKSRILISYLLIVDHIL
jgi:hypothetical protein